MENRCYKCDFYYNDICNHYAEPSTTDDDKCSWFKEKSAYDMDAYHAAVKALVVAAEKLTTKMEDIYVHPEYQAVWIHYNNLSYGGYKGPQWTKEFDNLKEAIADVERLEVE